jgi:N-acetylglucosamine-6-sulfatase
VAKNVLYVVLDDSDYAAVRYHMTMSTWIANNGVNFNDYRANSTVCASSRGTMMTGLPPHHNGVIKNQDAMRDWIANNNSARSIFKLLKDRAPGNVRTLAAGKLMNLYDTSGQSGGAGAYGSLYVLPGLDWALHVGDGGYQRFDWKATAKRDGAPYLIDKTGPAAPASDFVDDVISDWFADFLADHIANHAGDTFFALLTPYASHNTVGATDPADPGVPGFVSAPRDRKPGDGTPLSGWPSPGDDTGVTAIEWPPRGAQAWNQPIQDGATWRPTAPLSNSTLNNYEKDNTERIRSLQTVNDLLLRARNDLIAANMLDDTYIILSSDNGYHLGDHAIESGKGTSDYADVHLPLLVYPPGGLPVGGDKEIGRYIQTVDMVPTFLEIADATKPNNLGGKSILPWIYGPKPKPVTWRKTSINEYVDPDEPVGGTPGSSTPPSNFSIECLGARYTSYSPTVPGTPIVGRAEAFDLTKDPECKVNLYPRMDPSWRTSVDQRLRAMSTAVAGDFWELSLEEFELGPISDYPDGPPGDDDYQVDGQYARLSINGLPVTNASQGRRQLEVDTAIEGMVYEPGDFDSPGMHGASPGRGVWKPGTLAIPVIIQATSHTQLRQRMGTFQRMSQGHPTVTAVYADGKRVTAPCTFRKIEWIDTKVRNSIKGVLFYTQRWFWRDVDPFFHREEDLKNNKSIRLEDAAGGTAPLTDLQLEIRGGWKDIEIWPQDGTEDVQPPHSMRYMGQGFDHSVSNANRILLIDTTGEGRLTATEVGGEAPSWSPDYAEWSHPGSPYWLEIPPGGENSPPRIRIKGSEFTVNAHLEITGYRQYVSL